MCIGPSNAEIAALLHIDLPKTGPKSFWQLAQTFPNCGVGKKFYRKVCFAYPLPCCDSELTHERFGLQSWRAEEGCYWEVTRVKQKVNNGKYPGEDIHGKAWGIFTWNGTLPKLVRHTVSAAEMHCRVLSRAGETDGTEREVRGTYKKVWKYLKE